MENDNYLSLLNSETKTNLLNSYLEFSKPNKKLIKLDLFREEGITERGKKVLSPYPLFGKEREKIESYPMSFLLSIVSLINLKKIPQKSETFFRSEEYRAIFLSLEEDLLFSFSTLVLNSFIKLKLISLNSDNYFSLEREMILSFLSLSYLDRLSYILSSLSSMTEEEAKKVIYYSSFVSALNEREFFSIPFFQKEEKLLPLLKSLLIIEEENGLLYGKRIEKENEEEEGYISSDLLLTFTRLREEKIVFFSSPVKIDRMEQYLISKESIKGAFDFGFTTSTILSSLRNINRDVPSFLIEKIELWWEEWNMISLSRSLLLSVDERYEELFSSSLFSSFVLSHPKKGLFIIDYKKERELREKMKELSLFFPSITTGPLFSEEEKEVLSPIATTYFILNTSSEIKFDEKRYNELLNSSKSKLEYILLKNNMIFSHSSLSSLSFADGLDYQKKEELIKEGKKTNKSLCYLFLDEELHFIELNEEAVISKNKLYINNKTIDISKIWKLWILDFMPDQMD